MCCLRARLQPTTSTKVGSLMAGSALRGAQQTSQRQQCCHCPGSFLCYTYTTAYSPPYIASSLSNHPILLLLHPYPHHPHLIITPGHSTRPSLPIPAPPRLPCIHPPTQSPPLADTIESHLTDRERPPACGAPAAISRLPSAGTQPHTSK